MTHETHLALILGECYIEALRAQNNMQRMRTQTTDHSRKKKSTFQHPTMKETLPKDGRQTGKELQEGSEPCLSEQNFNEVASMGVGG